MVDLSWDVFTGPETLDVSWVTTKVASNVWAGGTVKSRSTDCGESVQDERYLCDGFDLTLIDTGCSASKSERSKSTSQAKPTQTFCVAL